MYVFVQGREIPIVHRVIKVNTSCPDLILHIDFHRMLVPLLPWWSYMHYDYAAKALMFLSEFAPIWVNDWTRIKLGSNMQHNSSYSLLRVLD